MFILRLQIHNTIRCRCMARDGCGDDGGTKCGVRVYLLQYKTHLEIRASFTQQSRAAASAVEVATTESANFSIFAHDNNEFTAYFFCTLSLQRQLVHSSCKLLGAHTLFVCLFVFLFSLLFCLHVRKFFGSFFIFKKTCPRTLRVKYTQISAVACRVVWYKLSWFDFSLFLFVFAVLWFGSVLVYFLEKWRPRNEKRNKKLRYTATATAQTMTMMMVVQFYKNTKTINISW